MKRLILYALIISLAVPFFARIGGTQAMQGKITSLEKKDKVYVATVRLYDMSSADVVKKVKEGMSVRLIYEIETAQFRPPIGRVITVKKTGELVVGIEQGLLEQEIENPFTHETIKVEDLLSVGAEVSVSKESM